MGEEAGIPQRWIVTFAVALIFAVVMGHMVNGLAAYIVPLETTEGWSRAGTSAINSFGLVGLALGGLSVGRFHGRLPERGLVVLGVGAIGGAMVLAAAASAVWRLQALFMFAGFVASR